MLKKESACRSALIKKIESMLKNDTRSAMLRGGDENYFLGLSEHQVNKMTTQLRHVLKALQIAFLHYDWNKAMAWREACDAASKETISEHCRRTIEFWFLMFRKSNCKLPATK